MQDKLISPTEAVEAQHVATAVIALNDIAADPNCREDWRIAAAELLLRYGVRDPYCEIAVLGDSASDDEEIEY